MKLRFTTFLLLQFLFLFILVPKVQALWLVDPSGRLIKMDSNGQVLGDEDQGQRSVGRNEVRSETKMEVRNEEKRTEVKSLDANKEKIEIKSGENKREFESKGMKIKLDQKNGELKMKTKNELTGEETEIETKMEKRGKPELPEVENEVNDKTETEVLKIKDREDKDEIKIKTKNGEFVIDRNRVGATTNFPLSVDSSTNILTVTTPAGEKQVTVLPDQAVQNMLSRNIIDQVSGQDAIDLSSRVKMSQKSDGSLVYEVEGEKQEKLFGLMPLKFKKTAVVSVETGELLETKESFTDKLLGLISF
ncbi:hypothetical protein HZB78_05120 [Candidatus Collierbacteria bacterium]|nr:hypothetical protein [Candidatus Collierbacteria bacterium]